MRLPLLAAAANHAAWALVAPLAPPVVDIIGFTAGRIGLMIWAGYLVVRDGGRGLWGAAFAGLSIMIVDHVVLNGGWFLIEHLRGAEVAGLGPNSHLMAFGGVVVSFVMFSPLTGLFGVVGGILGRRQQMRLADRTSEDP